MFEQVQVIKTIDVAGDKVWQAVSAIDGLERWFPIIHSCRVEGEGVGAIRVLSLADGTEMKDCIEEINHQDRRFRYLRTDHPFPVSRYEGTVWVRDADNGRCEVVWRLRLTASEACDELTRFLRQALSDGVSGLEQDLLSQLMA